MTDLQYTYATPTPTRDATAVMGRRTVAWLLDFVLYVAFAGVMFALLAEYVDVPAGSDFLDACERLRFQDSDAAAGCLEIGDRAYISSNADNGVQTLAALGYFAFFVVLQGVAGGSPGKLLTGLRVVREDGRRAGIGRSLLRTVMWIVDGAPWFAPVVGFITGLTTNGHRRVGDMAAKTFVVKRRDVGQPVTTGSPVDPPAQGAWGAPPPMTGPMAASSPDPTMPPPAAPSTPYTPPPAVADLTPEISGVPDESPAPPPVPENAEPTWAPPTLDDEPQMPESEPPTTPEIDGPVDIAAPEVEASDDWWSGPEADPSAATSAPTSEAQAPEAQPSEAQPSEAQAPEAQAPPEMPAWDDPSPTPDTTGDTWSPPTTPGSEISEAENTSPTAGPAPFTAPGADPVSDAPPAPEPAPRPPPQWDQARNTYIQWEPSLQQWLQWDEASQRWKDIDT